MGVFTPNHALEMPSGGEITSLTFRWQVKLNSRQTTNSMSKERESITLCLCLYVCLCTGADCAVNFLKIPNGSEKLLKTIERECEYFLDLEKMGPCTWCYLMSFVLPPCHSCYHPFRTWHPNINTVDCNHYHDFWKNFCPTATKKSLETFFQLFPQ